MEHFEEKSIKSFPLKPRRWKRYINDTNVAWPHREEKLELFFDHLNNKHANIKFTVEKENNKNIFFLDILLTRQQNGSLSH